MDENTIELALKKIFKPSESNKWKPADKIPLVTKEIDKLKSDLRTFIDESDYDIKSICKEGGELLEDSNELIHEMEACQLEIEQKTMAEIVKSIENHDSLTKELAEVNFTLNIIGDIITCGKYVNDFEETKNKQSLNHSVDLICDLLMTLEHPVEGFNKLGIYENVKTTASMIWEKLFEDLTNQWDQLVVYSVKTTGKNNTITINIKIDEDPGTIDVLMAMAITKQLPEKVAVFSNFLLKDVIIPIIHQECTVNAETDELMTLTIEPKTETKPAYNAVIANIRLLFHYLSNKLNLEIGRTKTIMMMIGDNISKEFCDILTKECLIGTIPSSISELQTYGRITAEIQDFQHFLTIVKFFPEKNLSILQYVDNIDVLFAERCSEHFLETARQIMLKDLSNTMSIGVETIPDESASNANVVDSTDVEALKIFDSTIPLSLFYFPRCMISKTAQELLDLIYMMMEQAVQCSDVVCKRLYMTTKLVFELYDAVVPYHHENFLQTIPQYVALYHNNCMYLAHNLLTFGDKWLTLMEGRCVRYPIGFLELVPRLRASAHRMLAQHLQTQRSQIHHFIRSSDLNCIVVKDVLSDNAEQAIRQCLRQLQLLKNVWIGVFPINVFTRLMATLVNMFVEEIIHRVCTVEDISAEMATQLTEIYTLVVKKAPNMFQKPADIESHVKSWVKLQELILVLGGSLKDIEKRWDDGTGPLAIHFRTEELRSLIKALFQNTQIRANLLVKIK